MGRTSDYGHGLYKQLEEVMARLDCVEKTSAKEIEQLNGRIDSLEKENADLIPPILLRPIKKAENRQIPITGGKRPGVRQEGRQATKEQHLQRQK